MFKSLPCTSFSDSQVSTKRPKKASSKPTAREGSAWQTQSSVFCKQVGIAEELCSWTAGQEASGVSLDFLSDRAKKLCDIAVAMCEQSLGAVAAQANMNRMYADVSQNVNRRPWTFTGVLPSMTTSSSFFSFGKKRMIKTVEHFRIMGFDHDAMVGLEQVGERKLHNLIGEAMSLPSVGTVLFCLLTELPNLFEKS